MEHRKLGRTNLKISSIGIGGGAFFGSSKTADQVGKVISFSIENGINFVETAEDYGEEKIAPAIRDARDGIVIASKSFSSNQKDMERSIRNSLGKLQTDRIEIYMMHTVDSIESLDFRIRNGVLDALKSARSEGMIDWIGISCHRIPTLIEAIKTNEFDVVEVPYCIGASETEKLFEYAKKYDVGIIAIRVLGGGILVDRSRNIEFMNARNALAYVLSNSNISCALVGMNSVEHVKENLDAVKSENISERERKEIEEKVKKLLGPNFCRGCLACMPCDAYDWKMPIDQLMRMEIFYSKYKMSGVLEEYKNLGLDVKNCLKCKECEKRCPYGVPIVENISRLNKLAKSVVR